MPQSVAELDLPLFDYTAPDFAADSYHAKLAAVRTKGWLAPYPLAYIVLEREAGEFFLRSRHAAFPGREIADFFGVTGGPLREHIEANILNQTGDQHRRLRALVGPAFPPRAANRGRPGSGPASSWRRWPSRIPRSRSPPCSALRLPTRHACRSGPT